VNLRLPDRKKRRKELLLKRQPLPCVKPKRMLQGSVQKLRKLRQLWKKPKDRRARLEKNRKDKINWLKRLRKKPREQELRRKRLKLLVLLLKRKKD